MLTCQQCACRRVHGCISTGETGVISQMKSIFSPCTSAPFNMSQDRIHLSNVTVLQLLELEKKIRIDTKKNLKECTHFMVLSRMS